MHPKLLGHAHGFSFVFLHVASINKNWQNMRSNFFFSFSVDQQNLQPPFLFIMTLLVSGHEWICLCNPQIFMYLTFQKSFL